MTSCTIFNRVEKIYVIRDRHCDSQIVVGLFPWGDVWEDFYATLGVSFEEFCETFTGSWQFGYVAALRAVGVHSVIYYSSTLVSRVVRVPHKPSGAIICMIPAPASYRRLHGRMVHPHHSMGYWGTIEGLFGEVGARRHVFEAARQAAPYLATSLRQFRTELKRDGCRGLVCQDYEGPQFDKAAVLGRFMGLPVYAIFQGGVSEWNRIGRFIRPRTMKLATGFIIGPRSEIDRVTGTYGIDPEKIHCIFNAVAEDYWVAADKAEARQTHGLKSGTIVVAWHGRVQMRQKGLDVLLDAWEQIADRRGDRSIRLMLLGDGPDAGALRERLERLRHRNVVWIDEFLADRSRIRKFLAVADIYAFPSRREGLPVAPTEAMAAGLPVVAADASGVKDIFKDGERSGGIVVERGKAGPFADALERLIGDASLRRELGVRAFDSAKRRFTADAIGRQLAVALKLAGEQKC